MTPAPPDAPPTGAVCGDGVASVDARYACAAGGRLSGASVCGDSEEADLISAWRAPRPGLAVWSAWAARRAASGRAPVAGGPRDRPRGCPRGGRARVVVVARPVVRHTRPTADCRPAASGPFVSRSSSCACSPCGDPQTSGWLLTLRWLQTLRMVACIGMVPSIAMVASIWRVASIGRVASRLGESVPSVAEGVRPPRRAGRAGRDTLSRSSSCACSPCGDPLDIGRVTYIWIVTYV